MIYLEYSFSYHLRNTKAPSFYAWPVTRLRNVFGVICLTIFSVNEMERIVRFGFWFNNRVLRLHGSARL